jgi:hypothetical protein
MSTLPQLQSKPRLPRLRLDGGTPAVLRFQDGARVSGNLEVVSLSGGLLSLESPLAQGSRVKLMFVTGAGSVLAGAEMLPPIDRSRQPFRFVSLAMQDRRRLESIIPVSVFQDIVEPDWMKKLRAASEDRYEPAKWRTKLLTMGAVGLITLGLVGAVCVGRLPLLKLVGR